MGTFLFLNRKSAVIKRNVPFYFSNGQGMIEYAILLVVVIYAFVAMRVYMQRGIQAVLRVASDEVGQQVDSFEDADKGAMTDSVSIGDVAEAARNREFLDGTFRKDHDLALTGISLSTSQLQSPKAE